LILMGKDYDTEIAVLGKRTALWEHIQRTTFPGVQGTPYLNNVAAKAVFFKEAMTDAYKARQFKIIENAQRLAADMADLGLLGLGTANKCCSRCIHGYASEKRPRWPG
jgi:glycine/serine hydroxymethyltransferase